MTALPKDPVPPVISKVLSVNTGLMVPDRTEPFWSKSAGMAVSFLKQRTTEQGARSIGRPTSNL
jgi:hypothetical protein